MTATYVCGECGERNAPGTDFCVSCRAFLAWDEVEGDAEGEATLIPARATTDPRPQSEYEMGTVLRPPPPTGFQAGTNAGYPVSPEVLADGSESRLQITAEQDEVTVPATGEPATLAVRVMNTSTIVDGYGVEAPDAPTWLSVEADQIHLLPGTDAMLSVRMRITSDTLRPAQKLPLLLRVRSMTQAGVHQDLPVEVTVPVIDVPVQLRAEPRLLRMRDTDTAECTVVVDNARSNRPMLLRFAGSDAEQAVRFDFDPPVLDVGPGASGSVLLAVKSTGPEPGQEISRSLTVTGFDGTRNVETMITLQQSTSVRVQDPPVTLEIEPSLVRVRDTTVGWARVIADNRGGAEWAHLLQLKGGDPERIVRVTWSAPELHIPPGRAVQTEARFDAPLPEAGTEVSRTVTLSGTDGRRTSTATVTFVQAASASPMTTLAVRIEPSVVRVRDADSASVQVVVDNRRGQSGVRIFLGGSDPERAARFTFSPPVVDVAAGQVQFVDLRIDSWRPPPGQEWTRQFTVTASDGQATVEGSGSLVQASSRAAIELLGVRLDPSVLRLSNRREGQLTAMVDNRNGALPIRISLRGDDPENIVRFTFAPGVLDVPPGQVASSVVRVKAPRAPGGREVTRPFMIVASDGRSEAQSQGSLIQSSSERRPIARFLFTLFGGLAMIIGAFLPWRAVSEQLGVGLDVNTFARLFGLPEVDLNGFEQFLSAGLALAALGVLVIFGLTGRSGRLSRLAAVLGALLVIGVLVTFALANRNPTPDSGAILALFGCVAGYIGGKLVRR